MLDVIGLPLLSRWFRLLALSMTIALLSGCLATERAQQRSWAIRPEKEIERNIFPIPTGDDVVGQLAVMRLRKGDSLPDAARHFSLGVNSISAANPGVDLWAPEPGERIVLPLSFILPVAQRKGIVVNLATMRLFQFKGEGKSLVVSTYPVGVGTKERPTPTGQMRVARKATDPTWHVPVSISEDHRKKGDPLPAEVPPGPENPLGECALYLSKSGYLIHGTNKPSSIGLNATNGCLRLYPENAKKLYDDTSVNTPVVIVNQPYLVGQRRQVLYLEAHPPREGSGAMELEKLHATLRKIQEKTARKLDWKKVKEVESEARGIPVPILGSGEGEENEDAETIEVEHPESLFGRPAVPELRLDGWYVLAADVRDELEAVRISAIINHQGPPIPARVISRSNDNGFRVLAGPFPGVSEAKDAAKRLKIDLEIEGVVIEPVEKIKVIAADQ